MTLLGFTSSVVAALTLQHILLLSAHDETLTEQRLRGADSTAVCPLHFAEESFAASVRDSVERLSLEHRPLLVHTRNEVRENLFTRIDHSTCRRVYLYSHRK